MLAGSTASLADLDVTLDPAHALQRAVNAATRLFEVDGVGVMLAAPDGRLRWAVASDQRVQLAGDNQEVSGQGPCQVAFAQGRPVHLRDAGVERAWGEIALLYVDVGLPASLSVPIVLAGGPVGTLDLFARTPRDWHDTNVAAVQAYASLVASLLSLAARAEVRGALAQPAADRAGAAGRPDGGIGVVAAGGQLQGTPGRRRRPELLGGTGKGWPRRSAGPSEPARTSNPIRRPVRRPGRSPTAELTLITTRGRSRLGHPSSRTCLVAAAQWLSCWTCRQPGKATGPVVPATLARYCPLRQRP